MGTLIGRSPRDRRTNVLAYDPALMCQPPEPVVSVVLPTHDRAALLQRALAALFEQAPAVGFEIVVVDDGSADATSEMLAALEPPPGVRLRNIHQARRGPAAARNRGLRESSGAIVAFTDDDCVVAPGWVAAIVAAFSQEDAPAGFGGPLRSLPSEHFVGRFQAWATADAKPCEDATGILWLNAANAAFTRQALLAVGGFDETFVRPGGEEVDLCRRMRAAGFRLGHFPTMVVAYAHRETLFGMFATYFQYGRGQRIGQRVLGTPPAAGLGPKTPAAGVWRRLARRWARRDSPPVNPFQRLVYFALDLARDAAYHLGALYERLAEPAVPRDPTRSPKALDST
jgi:GT2 family glycosyltransferase